MHPTCDVVVVTCIDFRLQPFLDRWLQETVGYGNYDRVALAGGVKNWEAVFPQIEIARNLHRIKKAILINHEDCGAYGEQGTPEQHFNDLRQARMQIWDKFLEVDVEMVYLRLDGTFERVG